MRTTIDIDHDKIEAVRLHLGAATMRDTIERLLDQALDARREERRRVFEEVAALGIPRLTDEDRAALWGPR